MKINTSHYQERYTSEFMRLKKFKKKRKPRGTITSDRVEFKGQIPRSTIKELFYVVNIGNSLIAQLVKNLPAIQETLVQFLGWEDLLVKE